ncbi:MAG: ATP-binding protein [Burkholderiales bacterium]
MEQSGADTSGIDGCIDDLDVILSARASSDDRPAKDVLSTLLHKLIGVLQLDFACVRSGGAVGASPTDFIRLAQHLSSIEQTTEVARAFSRWLAAGRPKWPVFVPNPTGEGNVSITLVPIGLHDEIGVLVAGASRSDFPTSMEMLMLRVAASQVAVGLHEARSLAAQQHPTDLIRCRERLTESNKKLRQEITERERLELLLRELNEEFETVLDNMTDRFFAVDSEWRYTRLNKAARAQMSALGKNPADLIGKILWAEFPRPDSEAALRQAMRERVVTTRTSYSAALEEWYENRIYPYSNGGLAIYQSYSTQQKKAEEALRRSEAYLAEGQRISHTGTWAWNLDTGELFWSLEHFRICGVDPHHFELTMEAAQQLIHPEDRIAANEAFFKAISERQKFEWSLRVLRPDGTIRNCHSVGRPVFNESGELTEYVGTILDDTERKAAAETLHRAHAALAQMLRLTTMGEVAASLAHELNQPLAAVVTNAQACQRWLAQADTHEAGEALERIVRDANRASAVISRIRAFLTRGETCKAAVKVDHVMLEVANAMQMAARAAGVWLRVEPEGDVPPVMADRVQLQQVILNLVTNAIEATREVPDAWRVLILGAKKYGDDAVLVTVRDTGAGLDATHRDRIFDAFYTTKRESIGMGLAISRSIVEAHGGRIWLTPNNDRGETFQFTLPIVDSATSVNTTRISNTT